MLRRSTLLALPVVVFAAGATLAETALERMEAISESVTGMMYDEMVVQVPSLDGRMPDPAWTDDMRDAYACVLDRYTAASSAAEVDAFLGRMEVALANASSEAIMNGGLDGQIGMPEGVDEAQSQEIMNRCGVVEIMLQQMSESGAMGVMMQQ